MIKRQKLFFNTAKRMKMPARFFFIGLILVLSARGGMAQCAGITFTASDTIGCAPLVTKFTVQNFPPGSDFSWDFGGGYSGQSSGDSVKTNIFNGVGFYTIRLRVYLPGGTICNYSKTNYIELVNKPNAQFTLDKPLLCYGGDTVTFTDITPRSQSRDWLIDGVSYSNGPKVLKHYFNLTGFKSVSLSVRDSLGCYAIANVDSVINVLDSPILDFTASLTEGCAPINTNFFPSVSGLNNQTITSYSWLLPGSSNPVTSMLSPTVAYISQGSYDVTLTITTNLGCTYTLKKTAFINIGDTITVSFQANSTSICRRQSVRMINTTVGMPLPGLFTWLLPANATLVSGSMSSDTIFVTFNALGTYDFGLKYEYHGCVSVKNFTNYITVLPPLAGFSSNDRINCFVPDTVRMTNVSLMPATGTNSYVWTVFDVNGITVLDTSTAQHPTFIINKFGKFDVRLIATNSNGCSDTLRYNSFIIVDTAAGNFIASPLVACPGQNITLMDVTPPFCNKAPNRYLWTFYSLNGINTLDFSSGGNDTTNSPVVRYDTVGTYTIKMVVYNNFGCGDTVIRNNYITIGYPTANFSVSDSNICSGTEVVLNQQTNPPVSTLVHQWTLQHTDSNITITGTGASFNTILSVPGKYNVSYKANNGIYCNDSATKPAYIAVNGIKGNIAAAVTSGCNPSLLNFTSSVEYNFHFQNPSPVVIYQWSCVPSGNGATSSGYTILTPNNSTTGISFTETGTYLVYCQFFNSEGCSYIDSSKAIQVNIGVKASFAMSTVFCLYDTGFVTNTSLLNPVSYKWYSDGVATFLPSDTSKNPIILFALKGFHSVSLIARSVDGCLDTFTHFIVVTKPTADFITDDTLNICGPILVTFHSRSSSDVVLYTWDFGDGSPLYKSTDTTISHVFAIKNGQSNFTIKLTVENNYGCKDVMIKQNYVRIIGPVPYFKISNNKGCEPLNVHIVDSSRNVFKFYFYYGFGPIDSVNIGDKVYTLASPNVPYSVYKPYLFVTDNTGTCYQIYNPADSIVVYSNPKAYFYTNDISGCAPLTVNFIDTSAGATRWKWDFENDGIIDDTTQNPVHVYTGGSYSVKLIVINQFGCTDTLLKTNYITAHPRPVVKFDLSDTIVCPHTAISFVNQSTSTSAVVRYHWDFGIPGVLDDTSDNANPAPYVYDVSGVYTVKLYMLDAMGCDDSLVRTNVIKVLDSLPPSQPQIYYVTVVNDKDIRIIWNTNIAPDFTSYNLYRSIGGPFAGLISKTSVSDTTHLDTTGINVKTQPYAYTIDANDNCNLRTALGTIHQSIYLDATTLTQNSNFISWTAYRGWAAGTYTYRLYRSHTYTGGYSLYAQLTDFDTTFTDTHLCDSDYYYYVEAIQAGTGFVSRSNIDFNHPPFFIPNSLIDLTRATVINNQSVLVEWDTTGPVSTNRLIYLLDKLDPNGNFQNITSTAGNSYVDNAVDVDAKSYTYRVRMLDYCGNMNPGSNIGRSINLTIFNQGYDVHLNWNAYADWSNGLQAYIVEYFDNFSRTFKVVAVLPPSDTAYIDRKFYKSDTAYCYRVKAVEAIQAIPDTSVSNEACIMLPPAVVVPNAFSPNGDALNDYFLPEAIFIQNLTGKPQVDYSLRVYDRWGTLMFETNDLHKGWDGTFMDRNCDIGVYVYELRATGYNKQRFNYKGTFHLLR